MKKLALLMCFLIIFAVKVANASESLHPAVTAAIPINQLQGYYDYNLATKSVIMEALDLSQQHLTYLYGSASPINKGMDCSGVINYLLKQLNVANPPRQASTLYLWALKEGKMYVLKNNEYNSSEFSKLKPGDLLFWSGTYETHNYPPITHVTIYLGKNENNQPLMFGSSDGRPYQGKEMWGVSVYDFILPAKNSPIKLVGYSCIPSLTCT